MKEEEIEKLREREKECGAAMREKECQGLDFFFQNLEFRL